MTALACFQPMSQAVAAVVVLDEFTGNSGAVPAGWTDIGPDVHANSTVVESGTVVTINDARGNNGPQLIQSAAQVLTSAPLSLTVGVASMTSVSGSEPTVISLLGGLSGMGLMVRFNATTQNFALAVTNNGGSVGNFALPSGAHLPSYSGGAMSYTLVADTDSVRLTSTLDGFDSGDLLFSSLGLPGVDSLDDLGATLGLVLGTESAGSTPSGTLASVDFDRIEVTGLAGAPEPSRLLLAMLGLLGVAWRRRR